METSKGLSPVVAWAVLLGIAAWLLHPAFSPVHVEGFSASIAAIGIHIAQGTVQEFSPFAPLATDYFGLTKYGTVLSVATLAPLFGGDGALRLVMLVGLALALASSTYLVRRWSGARWWVVALSLLVVPGVAESAFHFNDNVPAAGLFLVGLAILVHWRRWWATGLAGLLIGGAITARLDMALLAFLAVPLVVWEQQTWRASATVTAACGIVALATIFALFAMAGVTPFDALRAGMAQVEVWARPLDINRQSRELLYFIGLPGAVLALVGVLHCAREQRWYRLGLLVGVPMMINLLQLGTLWQARQFVALAPFLCALAACGIEAMIADFKEGRRAFPAAIAIFALLVVAAPVRGLTISDGPHEYVGRFAGIALWRDWQQQVREDFRRIDDLIDSAPHERSAPLMILADYWNEDRYLHLRLIERGFRRVALPAACGVTATGFGKGDQTIIAFRANEPTARVAELTEEVGPCVQTFPGARLVLLADSGRSVKLVGRASPNASDNPGLVAAGMGWFSVVPLDQTLLSRLIEAYRREGEGLAGPRSLEEVQQLQRSRTPFSG